MSRLEALWTVRFGRPETPASQMEGGVVVLETGRMLGGDSIYAYVGSYEARGDSFVGQLSIKRHNHTPGVRSIYGGSEREFDAAFTAKRVAEDHIEGTLKRDGQVPVKVVMRWLAPLP